MARLIAYHSLLGSVVDRSGDERTLLREGVRSVVYGFVPNEVYTGACILATRKRVSGSAIRERVRETIALDLNPVAALLRGCPGMQEFAAAWNAFHTTWMLAADTRLFPKDGGRFDYVRNIGVCAGGEALREKIILHTIDAVLPGSNACKAMPGLLPLVRDLGMDRSAMHDLVAVIDGDLEIGIDDAARRLHMSTRALQRVLKQHGVGFSEIRMACRLVRAARLLRESRMPITDIALESGFFDAAHFARSFAMSAGVSASQYRSIAGMASS